MVKNQNISNDHHPIIIISLCHHVLNLRLGRSVDSELYHFDDFGEIRIIPYNDMKKILESNRKFAKDGYYYILDSRIVEEYGLSVPYNSINIRENIDRLIIEKPEIKRLINLNNKKEVKN